MSDVQGGKNWSDINVSEADKSWPKIPCNDGWYYDSNQLDFVTIPMNYSWVCDQNRFRIYIAAAWFVGSILGSLVFGYLCDHWGRFLSFFLANWCVFVGAFWTSMCENFYCFFFARFVAGFGVYFAFLSIYILSALLITEFITISKIIQIFCPFSYRKCWNQASHKGGKLCFGCCTSCGWMCSSLDCRMVQSLEIF